MGNAQDENYQFKLNQLEKEIQKVIIGQSSLVRVMICTLLSKGHILLEGVPGLAKTLAVSTFAQTIGGEFKRIQFTPDKLPSDITGVMIYNESTCDFEFYKGPIFCNILLADEINRASPKVQSALLEAMQEKKVTVEREGYNLPDLFMVLASQNPIEQMGTYPLSEAQLDRFMTKVEVDYPSPEDEAELYQKKSFNFEQIRSSVNRVLEPEEVLKIQDHAFSKVKVSKPALAYIQAICLGTRTGNSFVPKSVTKNVLVGVSPRGGEHLISFAKSFAFLQGRNYVSFEDIDMSAQYVLGHRIVLRHSAVLEGIRGRDIINEVIHNISPYDLVTNGL